MAEEIDTGIDETPNGDSEGLLPEQAHETAPQRRHHRGRTVLKGVGITLAAVIALIVAASGKPARVKLYGPDVHV